MNEVEYVVPPESGAPKVSNNQVKPPKKPGKVMAWINSNRALSAAGLLMAVIIVLAGTAMITGQKVSIFGLQLNPLYQQANCPITADENQCGGLWDGGGTSPIAIEGSFSKGIVGQPYSQDFKLSGSVNLPCDWTVSAPLPPFDNATIKEGVFTSTPSTAGTYQVGIKVLCQNGQSTTKTLPWVVEAAPAGLTINGDWPEGTVGQPYSTLLSLSSPLFAPCTWTIVSSTPALNNATITPRSTQSSTATFSATIGTVSGNYKTTIKAACSNNQVAQREFSWTVKPTRLPPEPAPLSIKASFSDGVVNQAYTTNLQTENAPTSPCDWTLLKVTPTIAGAAINRVDNVAATKESESVFSAKPTTAGTYKVQVGVSCNNPVATTDKMGNTAQREFTWIVKSSGSNGGGGGGGGGSTASNCSANKDKLVAIYRFWKASDGDHFFTTNANEKPAGYVAEGIAGYVYKEKVTGTTAIYRSYHSGATAHYYSTTNDATNYGYANEGILGYAFSGNASGALPWFRLHKGYPQSDYLETTHTGEKAQALAMGYVDEGVVANICEKNT